MAKSTKIQIKATEEQHREFTMRIKQIHLLCDVPFADIANELGVSRQFLSALMHDKAKLSKTMWLAWCSIWPNYKDELEPHLQEIIRYEQARKDHLSRVYKTIKEE